MDSFSDHPNEFEAASATAAEPQPDVAFDIGADERRMHVRAYNYWCSLLDGRDYPCIEDLEFSIYNRWGEMVFESNTRKLGWNGIYKGKLQPMDVYTYTLDVVFTDGKKARKTGDITLLR